MPEGTINGEPYKVPDGYLAVSEREWHRASAALTLLQDLSRSEHGRHEGDIEIETLGGVSLGNKRIRTGQTIGHGIDGSPIVVPPPRERGNPDAWRPR
jgi:hypothetical protein